MNFQRARKEAIGIELTPLIDIIFQLVLFFMVSTTFDQSPAIDIDLPESSSQKMVSQDTSLDIWIDKEGGIVFEKVQLSPTDLEQLIHDRIEKKPDLIVVVNADQSVEHRVVVKIIDRLQVSGVQNISIGTSNKQ